MKEKLSFIFIVLLMAMGVYCFAGADNPVDTSTIEADIVTAQAAADAAQATADAAIPDNTSSGTITNITVDRIYFTLGGTNSWITMSSATSGVWRINGQDTEFNYLLGQE